MWSEEIAEVWVFGRRRLVVRVTGGSGSRSKMISPGSCSKRQLDEKIDRAVEELKNDLLEAEREYYHKEEDF